MAAKTAHHTNSARQARRLRAAAAHRRAMNLKRASEPLIPSKVLRALAAMKLPKNKRVYNARLRELLGGV
jgi:hypothetical protein